MGRAGGRGVAGATVATLAGVDVRSEIVGSVWHVMCVVGQRVDAGDELLILESMKMEIPVAAPVPGTVAALHVERGDHVRSGDLLAEIG